MFAPLYSLGVNMSESQPTKTVIVHVHDGPKPAKFSPLWLIAICLLMLTAAGACHALAWLVEVLR